MKYSKYFISDENGKSNCVIRTFCKVFNKDYKEVQNELIKITKELNANSYNNTEVFEQYLSLRDFSSKKIEKDIKVSNLNLSKGIHIVLCWDKKDYYHMLPIINNIVYDKNNNGLDLYVLKTYSKEEGKI